MFGVGWVIRLHMLYNIKLGKMLEMMTGWYRTKLIVILKRIYQRDEERKKR